MYVDRSRPKHPRRSARPASRTPTTRRGEPHWSLSRFLRLSFQNSNLFVEEFPAWLVEMQRRWKLGAEIKLFISASVSEAGQTPTVVEVLTLMVP